MWKIINRDPYAQIERRRKRAAKKHKQAREKAWQRKNRKEAWRNFKRRINGIISNPFARRKPTPQSHADRQEMISNGERRHSNRPTLSSTDRKKAWKRKERAKKWQQLKVQFGNFLAHPFAKRELTPIQRRDLQIKRMQNHDRKIARKKFIEKVKTNPLALVFPQNTNRGKSRKSLRSKYRLAKEDVRKKIAKGVENYKMLKATPDAEGKFVKTFLLSTAYYIMAFLIIYVIYQVVTILVASHSHISGIWYYYQLKFPLNSPLYTRANLILIFSSGPLVSLMLALGSLRMFFSHNIFFKRFRLFYLWGFICGVNMFFGAYIVGFITRTEFIYTSEWLFLSDVFDIEEIIFTLISFGMLIGIGRIVTPLFLFSSGSVTLIKPEFRLYFIISQVILPWMAGVIILFVLTLPNYYIPLVLKTITPAFILFPSLVIYNSRKFAKIHKSGVVQHNYFRWSIIIVFFALLLFYRVILNFGLKL
ncbi:MAG: hypothetical protein ACOYN4_17390, partial [Bacteroidales bacterium]